MNQAEATMQSETDILPEGDRLWDLDGQRILLAIVS
jgi:hypothetical protein